MDTLIAGFPAREYRAFAVLVLVFVAVNAVARFRSVFDRIGHALAVWLRGRGLFTLTDPDVGQWRIDCFRIALGGVAGFRCLANLLPTAATAPADLVVPQ